MGIALLFSFSNVARAQSNDKLLGILKSELQQQFSELKGRELPPYMMSYRVIDTKRWSVSSLFGNTANEGYSEACSMIPQVRVGDMTLDNFTVNFSGGRGSAVLPIDNTVTGEEAIRQAIWRETMARYETAISAYQNVKVKKTTEVESSDKSPAFGTADVEKYYEAPITGSRANLDLKVWRERLNELSSIFKYDANITNGGADISYLIERRYFIDTEGREVVQNLPYCRVMVRGTIKADDGMELPLYLSYFAYDPKDLPSQESMMNDTKKLYAKLQELRNAPLVDPYTGPAILSGAASGVFFHEIFGHRIEGRRMKSDSDGQTFKKMVGEYVLPKALSVYDDPTLTSYEGEDLNGFYRFDDEGVRGERVTVVDKGILNEFLMTRTPIDGFPKSNGHARGTGASDPVSRQSNLIVETSDHKSDAELRRLLIAEIKRQKREFGYFFKEVTGGMTMTDSRSINSFDVDPLEVYKVYADGRPDELVRGVKLIGTPLSMFSNIIHAGGEKQIFTGMCGAESGSIPVTAISPTILVNKIEVQRVAKTPNLPRLLDIPVKKK